MKGIKENSNHGKKSNKNSRKEHEHKTKNNSNDEEKKEGNLKTNGKTKVIKENKKKVGGNQNKINILDDNVGAGKKDIKLNTTKEPMKILKYEPAYQDKLLEEIKIKLEKKQYKTEELIKDMDLILNQSPIISKFTNTSFLEQSSFEIRDDINENNFLLIVNLLNYINVINAIWSYVETKTDDFVNILKVLGIYFSWVKKEDKIVDVILLIPKSPVLYNYISTYGDIGFVNTDLKDIAKKYCEWNEKYNYDSGLCFEDLVTIHLSELLKDKYIIHPNVIYYIKKELAEKLIKLKIIDIPEPYILSSSNSNKSFHGYNENDLIITMLKDVKIDENYNFNEIINGNLKREEKRIIMEKGKTYIFEIKTKVEDIFAKIEHIEKVQNRFIETLINAKYNNKRLNEVNEYKKILICDQNYNDTKEKIDNKKLNNKNIIYSNPQVGITSLLQIKKDIKNLNKKCDILSNNVKELMQELKTERQNKSTIKAKKEELEKENKKLDSELKINEYSYKNSLYENSIQSLNNILKLQSTAITFILKSKDKLDLIEDLYKNAFNCFELVFKYFKKKEGLFFEIIEPFIDGYKDILDVKESIHIKNILIQKIDKSDVYSPYYEGLKNFLFGFDEKNPTESFEFMKGVTRRNIKYLFGFTEILEKNTSIENVEYKYQGAIIYLLYSMMGKDKLSIVKEFARKDLEKNTNKSTINNCQENGNIIKIMISLLNGKNYQLYEKIYGINNEI